MAFDLDGTLYAGGRALPGAVAAVRGVVSAGLRALYLTNTSGRTRAEIGDDLATMGFPVGERAVWTSAATTAAWLTRHDLKLVAMVGAPGLRSELVAAGLKVVSQTDACEALVVGLDRDFDFSLERPVDEHLAGRLRRGEALLIACNRDDAFPGQDGEPRPGCGRLVAMIERQCAHVADAAPGKPQPDMLLAAAAAHGLGPRSVLVVGDSVTSDAGMARAAGAPCALVPALAASRPEEAPDGPDVISLPGISELTRLLGLETASGRA